MIRSERFIVYAPTRQGNVETGDHFAHVRVQDTSLCHSWKCIPGVVALSPWRRKGVPLQTSCGLKT